MAAIDFATFNTIVPLVIDAALPVMIRGRHGVGKSELVYQTAKELGLPVVERRASQMTEGDLMGLPSIDGNSTIWNAPDWLKTACEQPVALFLDEVDRATPEVRQGIFELTDSRKLNGWNLHPGTRIFAAVNGGEACASQYQVGEMDPAELDRWTVFDVEPTTGDWLVWAKDKVGGLVWDFINQNRQHLEHAGEYEPNKVYPSRRSWARLDQTMGNMEVGSAFLALAAGFVGFEAAVTFRDFAANYERQVTVEDILDRGRISRTTDFGVTEHCALVEKLAQSGRFAEALSDTQIHNLADYFVSLPSEAAMKLFEHIGANENDQQNLIKLHRATATSGVSVKQHLTALVVGKVTAS